MVEAQQVFTNKYNKARFFNGWCALESANDLACGVNKFSLARLVKGSVQQQGKVDCFLLTIEMTHAHDHDNFLSSFPGAFVYWGPFVDKKASEFPQARKMSWETWFGSERRQEAIELLGLSRQQEKRK